MTSDEVTSREFVTDTGEAEDEEDVAGHSGSSPEATPDPEVRRRRAAEGGEADRGGSRWG